MPSIGQCQSPVVPSRPVRGTIVLLTVGLLALGGAPAGATPTPAGLAPPDHTGDWHWPVEGYLGQRAQLLRGFDPPAQTWLTGHRGVDLAAAPSAPIRAAGAGVVVFAAMLAGRGVVSVDHPGGLRTTYEPVQASVSAGEQVAAGDLLGVLEPLTAHCGRSCLHWGLRRGDTYLDPLLLVQRAPPVLLPYGAPVPVRTAPARLTSWWGGAVLTRLDRAG